MPKNVIDLQKHKEGMTPEQLMAMEPAAAERMFNRLGLDAQAELILKTPWAKRMDIILLAENSRELIQALPEEEVYWAIKERGVEDSLALISRTSHDQFQYLIDIDCWNKSEVDSENITRWYKLLARCNEDKVMEWFLKADNEYLVCTLKHFMRIAKIEEETDISEEYEMMPTYTLDNTNYFKFLHDDDSTFILPLLNTLYQNDRDLFYTIMEGVIWDSEIEAEDESFHWRQGRVSEKGFPELDEALTVYSRLTDQEIRLIRERDLAGTKDKRDSNNAGKNLIRYTVSSSELPGFLERALSDLNSGAVLDDIQKKMICLANKIVISDNMEVREVKDLKRALKKVAGYINIGLELLSQNDFTAAGTVLERLHPETVFRVGFSRVLIVKDTAEHYAGPLWQHSRNLFSAFMDSPWVEAMQGSVMVHPQFFEGILGEGEYLFRDFKELNEILKTEEILEMVRVADNVLFEGFQVSPQQIIELLEAVSLESELNDIKCSTVFLTVLANHILKDKSVFKPLGTGELQAFLDQVFRKNSQTQEYCIDENLCEQTVAWVAGICRSVANRSVLDQFIDACLRILHKEFSALVSKKTIDKRFVSAILIK